MAAVARSGVGPRNLHVLTTRGRTTGKARSNPVQLVIEGEDRWLVAPYGEVGWVKNARAAGEVTLSRGSRSARYGIQPANATDAGRILKHYVKIAPVVLPYFDAGLTSSEEEFAREADRHPVFKLVAR